MQKILLLTLYLFLLVGCSENKNTVSLQNEASEERVIVSTNTDSLQNYNTDHLSIIEESTVNSAESVQEKEDYLYFEDYASLTTKTALYQEFDSVNLKDAVEWYAEGTEKFDVTYLTNPLNSHLVKYCWSKDGSEKLTFIEANYFLEYDSGKTQKISSKAGLWLGMPLKDLVAWNGADFNFMGFGWDYEGTIMEENNSKLAEINTFIKLSLDYNALLDEYNHLLGDIEFSSADSAVKIAPIIIDRFTYNL